MMSLNDSEVLASIPTKDAQWQALFQSITSTEPPTVLGKRNINDISSTNSTTCETTVRSRREKGPEPIKVTATECLVLPAGTLGQREVRSIHTTSKTTKMPKTRGKREVYYNGDLQDVLIEIWKGISGVISVLKKPSRRRGAALRYLDTRPSNYVSSGDDLGPLEPDLAYNDTQTPENLEDDKIRPISRPDTEGEVKEGVLVDALIAAFKLCENAATENLKSGQFDKEKMNIALNEIKVIAEKRLLESAVVQPIAASIRTERRPTVGWVSQWWATGSGLDEKIVSQ